MDILTSETGRFGKEVYNRSFPKSPIIALQPRGVFPEEMGQTINNLTYERTAPTTASPTWDTMVYDPAVPVEGGICLPTPDRVTVGSTTRSYSLARKTVRGPDFCAEELRGQFSRAKQLDSIVSALSGYTRILWEMRNRSEYFRMTQRKVVVTNTGLQYTDTMAATYPAYCPGAILTQGILDYLRMYLDRDGAGDSAFGNEGGAPILTLITSPETSNMILKVNEPRRQDLRWGAPGTLLEKFGNVAQYMGFYHVKDLYSRRFNCSGGVFTEVAPFSMSSATNGLKAVPNPAYLSAPYEESVIFDPTVYTQLIPKPITAPGADLHFDPTDYSGTWKFLNIPDAVCNPLSNIGFHYGVLVSASEPVHPERGVSIVHLRCDPSLELVTSCSNT